MTDQYRRPADLPQQLPVFPLQGCIMLPRSTLPLNVFEPRYLQMVADILAGPRILGIVQPERTDAGQSPPGKNAPLRRVGCAGRLTAYTETDEGTIILSLSGIARFQIVREVETGKPYRICEVNYAPFVTDFARGHGQEQVNLTRFMRVLRSYLDTHNLRADWEALNRSPVELLINTLAMISPYGPEEKQALLEAPDLRTRSEVLMALAEMDMASPEGGSGTTLQ
ncbi:LON peptidase substrate-binding domain-containing protein [Dichotomicrobium thermohalophilum]|uniref:LON peptidase substrate-binding domain-containing protein n=1 Tax=Dichotomicrobium thermohalophilum TaxID=933063 RepID=UPI00315C9CF3